MKKLQALVVMGLFLIPLLASAAPPHPGDTQGYVKNIVIMNDNGGTTIRVYFSASQNDRWGCISNPGYVAITTRSSRVSPLALALAYDNAQTAKQSGRPIAIDSSSNTSPCETGDNAWVVY